MNELLLVVSVVSIGDAAIMSRDKSEKLMRRKDAAKHFCPYTRSAALRGPK